MITVTFYYAENSPECDQVRGDLEALKEAYPHQLIPIDVNKDPTLQADLLQRVPIIQVGPYRLEGVVTRERLMVTLGAANDRVNQLEKIDQKAYQDKFSKGHTFSSSDKLSLWVSNNFLHTLNVILFIYIALPFLAPILMKNGSDTAAQVIYKIYSPVCHQLAYRSWFLYGEQAFYPRALAGVPGVQSYESVTGLTAQDVIAGRDFLGNALVGYKVAICQRDVAIYLSMLGFGIVYWLSGYKIRSLPWYLWLAVGLIPIGIDGFSQLPSVIPGLPGWLPIRESTPFLRTVTGGLFGIMTAWYLFPLIYESMRETYRMMTRKQAVSTQANTR
jgi:uncharacterized membrane protein